MSKSCIRIRNIYYMLSYAFSTLKQSGFEKVGGEEFDNIHNLFASILAVGIGQQLKRGLHREYIGAHDDLSVVRGKIDLCGTIGNRVNCVRKVACEFDELAENNIFNQILKTTVLLLLKCDDVDQKYRNVLKQEILFFSGVNTIDTTRINWSQISFRRNNNTYRMLIALCKFLLQGMLMSQAKGEQKLASFVDEKHMSRLYEKFILEYYRRHHPELHAAASQIPWALNERSSDYMLPEMHSDTTLSCDKNKKTLIIDAKYYSRNTQINQFDKQTIHSFNLYQIFTYVKNKTSQAGFKDHKISGLLLYARTTAETQPDADFSISGNEFSVKTLDLNCKFEDIATQLDKIAERLYRAS